MSEDLIKQIEAEMQPVADMHDLDIINANVTGDGSPKIEVIVERKNIDDPVTMESCAELSRQLGHWLDVKGFADANYVLDVCSSGEHRSLKTTFDFNKFSGREIQVKYFDEEEMTHKSSMAIVKKCDAMSCAFEIDGEELNITLENIKKASYTKVFKF